MYGEGTRVDGTEARDSELAWRRVPLWIRIGGLGSGCLLLIAGRVYLLGVVAMRLASLTIAMAAAVLVAALLQPVYCGTSPPTSSPTSAAGCRRAWSAPVL